MTFLVQQVEVKGKKVNVTIQTGRPKDSDRLQVGKPEKIGLHTTGGYAFESWCYNIRKGYSPDLNIGFVDGKLVSINQD